MAINYIKGEMLTANLLRGGVDLAIETDLLYIDVANGRLGVKTTTPATILDVAGDITASGTLIANQATIATTAVIGDVVINNDTLTTTADVLKLTSSSGRVEFLADASLTAAVSNITGGADSGSNNALPALTISTTFVDTPYYLGLLLPAPGVGFAALATANGLYMTPDGTTVFYVDSAGGGTADVDVFQTTLAIAFDLTSAGTATSTNLSTTQIGPGTEAAHGISFNPNGLEVYISKYTSSGVDTTVERCTLSTAFDFSSTITYTGNATYAQDDTLNFAPVLSEDGLKAYSVGVQVAATAGTFINEYTVNTAYDLTNVTFVNNFDIATQITHATNYISVAVSENGSEIFASQYDPTTFVSNVLASYDLGTAYDITSAVTNEVVFPATAGESRAFIFTKDILIGTIGFQMQFLGDDGNMYQYDTKNVLPTDTSAALSFAGTQKLITTVDGTLLSGELILPNYTTALLPATTNAGAVVYDTDVQQVKVNDGANWISSGSPAGVSANVLTATTTDASITEALDGLSAQLVLPDNTTWRFEANIVARRTDADDEGGGYKYTGVIDRNTGAASTAIVGVVAEVIDAEDNPAWLVTVTADSTNGALKIEVTGEAAKTIKWVVFVRIVAVTN